jgi:hypothetical protein
MTPEPSEPTPPLLPIGWKERLDFPEWGLKNVRVKIDTGACTSALGAADIELIEVNGRPTARLRLCLNRRRPQKIFIVEVPILRMVHVTNTGGSREQRPMIETTIRLGPVQKRIHLTVTRRDAMRFPMILGREALAGSFVVDVARKDVMRSKEPRTR